MSTWTTTVTGNTMSEIERAALAEFSRFFGDRYPTIGLDDLRLDVGIESVTRNGDGAICSSRYKADVRFEL